jgi:uncharacterized membrane protein YgaE (UPF0421/DUF939 family)
LARANVAAVQLAVRAAAAAGLSVGIAQLLRLPFPIYAMIAAVIVTDLSGARTRQLALPRVAGTALGAILGAAVGPFLQSKGWAIAVSICAGMLLSHLCRLDDAAKLTGYVAGIVVLDHGDHPWLYAVHRVTETLLGVAAAVVVSFVPKLLPTDRPDTGQGGARWTGSSEP